MLAALETGRQSVFGAWRRARRASAGRGGARAGRGAGRRRCPREVVFTSGGTEANVLALTPCARRCAAGVGDRASFGAQRRPVCGGRGNPGHGRWAWSISMRSSAVLAGASRPLVSIMLANNETGVVQPVAQAAAIGACRGRPSACRCGAGAGPDRLRFQGARRRPDDAVRAQDRRAAGRRRADQARRRSIWTPRSRAAARSAARAPAPRTCPASPASARPRRPSSRSLARRGRPDGVAARPARGRAQGDRARRRSFSAQGASRLPNTTLFAVPGMKAETAVIALDLEGVAVSSGAACSSGKVTPSHVLAAMGVPAGPDPGRDPPQPGLFDHGSRDRRISKGLG